MNTRSYAMLTAFVFGLGFVWTGGCGAEERDNDGEGGKGGKGGKGGSGGSNNGGSGGGGGSTSSGGSGGNNNMGGTPPMTGPDLIGHWKFDETSGTTVADSSGEGNNGVVVQGGTEDSPTHPGPNWVTDGKVGGALQFNGSSDWVRIPSTDSINTTALTGHITIVAWVKIVGSNPTGKEYNFVIQRHVAGTRYEHFGLGTFMGLPQGSILTDHAVGVQNVPTGQWTHMAQTYDGFTQFLYVNGEEATSPQDVGAPIGADVTPLTIGAAVNETEVIEHFPGVIDDVRLYNRALSANEIKALYDQTK